MYSNVQGRARPSLAQLYNWRYKDLGDLPNVLTGPDFLRANAGFAYDYQFVDVGDYQGQGESTPVPHFYQVREEKSTDLKLCRDTVLKQAGCSD